MSIGYLIGETEQLRELAEHWQIEQNSKEFGLDIRIDDGLAELDAWRKKGICDVIIDSEDGKIVGAIGLYIESHAFGRGVIAIVKYWYARPDYRRGIHLMNEAHKWAKRKGCTHIVAFASMIASDQYSKLCKLYDGLGMKLFESTFIRKV